MPTLIYVYIKIGGSLEKGIYPQYFGLDNAIQLKKISTNVRYHASLSYTHHFLVFPFIFL